MIQPNQWADYQYSIIFQAHFCRISTTHPVLTEAVRLSEPLYDAGFQSPITAIGCSLNRSAIWVAYWEKSPLSNVYYSIVQNGSDSYYLIFNQAGKKRPDPYRAFRLYVLPIELDLPKPPKLWQALAEELVEEHLKTELRT